MEPNGGNLYRKHQLMVNGPAGQTPWRCAHGVAGTEDMHTTGRWRDCRQCRTEDIRAYAEFYGFGKPHRLEQDMPRHADCMTINHVIFPNSAHAEPSTWINDPRFPYRATALVTPEEPARIAAAGHAWEAMWIDPGHPGQMRVLVGANLNRLLERARANETKAKKQ